MENEKTIFVEFSAGSRVNQSSGAHFHLREGKVCLWVSVSRGPATVFVGGYRIILDEKGLVSRAIKESEYQKEERAKGQ